MRGLILAFAAGVGVLQLMPELPDWRWFWLGAPLLVLASFSPCGSRVRYALLLVAAFVVGFAYAAGRAEQRLADALDPNWAGRDITLTGRVVGLVETTARGARLEFAVTHVATPGARVPTRLLLNVHEGATTPAWVPRGGDCLVLDARLWRPRGTHNPGLFDFEAWLFERGIRALGRANHPSLSTDCPASARSVLDALRSSARERLLKDLAGREYAGVISALALGDQNAISTEQWRLFRRTGVTHLMSISGLHVTLLGWLVFSMVSSAWRRLPALVVRWPARRVALWLGLAVSAGYVALSGAGIPAQRTLFMLAAACVALSLARAHSASRVLAVALLVVLIIDPWAILAIGFWLSFGVVAALLYAESGRLGRVAGWRAWGHAQWVATLALVAPMVFLFQEFSLVSPLANAFAIPVISLLAVPLALAAVLLPWAWPAEAARVVVSGVMKGLAWLDALPTPIWQTAAPGLAATLLALLGCAVLLAPRGLPGRWLGALLYLPLIWPRLERPDPGAYWLQALDVGQGLAVIVRTHDHALVYDAGPSYVSGEDSGMRVVAPRLRAQGIARLDGLLVSHDDIDHSGGARSLIASHAPDWLLSSLVDPGDGRLSAHGRAILVDARRPIP
jgi:competence protein ComEC